MPKERAKRLRRCNCPEYPERYQALCHWGSCTQWRCTACRKLDFSVGPAWCPCDGYVRWLRHEGMHNWNTRWSDEREDIYVLRVPVKPSKARRFQGGTHNRRNPSTR